MTSFVKEHTEEDMLLIADKAQNSRIHTFPVVNANNGHENEIREIVIADTKSVA